jgi:hypothetical protein
MIITLEIDKQVILGKIVDILQQDATVSSLIPLSKNISLNASSFTTISPSIEVCDGGDEVVSEIRRRTSVIIHVRTNKPDINESDTLCSQIEDAITNCLIMDDNLRLDGEVSRFMNIESQPLSDIDNPTVRIHDITVTYEVM